MDIAREFYRNLDLGNGRTVDDAAFARALHVAVGQVYAVQRECPLLWAPYIHVGV